MPNLAESFSPITAGKRGTFGLDFDKLIPDGDSLLTNTLVWRCGLDPLHPGVGDSGPSSRLISAGQAFEGTIALTTFVGVGPNVYWIQANVSTAGGEDLDISARVPVVADPISD